MKMLTIVYNTSCDEEIREILKDRGVRHFTQIPKVFGQGDAGVVNGSLLCPGQNAMILVVLPDQEAHGVAEAVRELVLRTGGCGCVPIRAFLVPCEQVV
ncbi:MAG: PG0541 family transporter-associated protein [Thermodesulfobacteriota bacterium]|jgi:nitrogen regulatory protein PII